ncbi:hypothetical protein IH781_03230 [Patescibacteria group bacterium]|nr:hypothetical protein [Patescibacteria group bacterium]
MHPGKTVFVGEEQITLGKISQGAVEIAIDDDELPSAPPPAKTVSAPLQAPRRVSVAEKPEQPSKKRWWRI